MGREFLDIFEEWAEEYDRSVTGHDPQYEAVFANYDAILNEVTNESFGNVLEFGVGTGNLSQKLLDAGLGVVGVEPSPAMRDIVMEKIPDLNIMDGDFISFPKPPMKIDTIVSTYAFHHLTDEEKEVAVKQFSNMLPTNGKVVFADTIFASNQVRKDIIANAHAKGYVDLVEDLNREYYTTIDVLKDMFERHHFMVSWKQMNDFVWILIANKK
ncbi:putative AdoMet-dependent methyltransferase [Oceanobacillus limi]|uniref:Uncharacterized methyltransferase SAMN05216389_101408 n=1 Tax=Oceanobacillus limi TaxID=930131 RepID=A0A1H9YHM0_9BACI|nr:class I SAM-dependent methyltransferase [Oceanobacillus limi]SES68553.1 putative AdoMet-dependent methyltransferase [Oceanobacillus limi]